MPLCRSGSLLGTIAARARHATSALASPRPARSLLLITSLFGALGFAGCAQQPEQVAAAAHGKEYFPSSKYGPASRRVIADGQPVPHGGGQYLVGKPYTVAGQTYYPSERHVVQVGKASWYGDAFHGRLTANGEIYDRDSFTAAHPTLPLPSYARVTNLRNNTSMIVRVNDRGPYASNRIMDVSRGVAEALDFRRTGTAMIKVEYVARASLAGSDDTKLLATLRTDGPARWQAEPTLVAERAPATARVASLAPYAPQDERTGDPDEARTAASDYADPVTGSQAKHRATRPPPERKADARAPSDDRRAGVRRPEPFRAPDREEARRTMPASRDARPRPGPVMTPVPRAELARLIEGRHPRIDGGRGGARDGAEPRRRADRGMVPPPHPTLIRASHGAAPAHASYGAALAHASPAASRDGAAHHAGLRLTASRDD